MKSKVKVQQKLSIFTYISILTYILLTCFSGVEIGIGVPGGTAGGGGSSTGPLAITSFTRFPHCLRTCATCSLLIPAKSVSPIFKMWSPLHSLPCWKKSNNEKKLVKSRNFSHKSYKQKMTTWFQLLLIYMKQVTFFECHINTLTAWRRQVCCLRAYFY